MHLESFQLVVYAGITTGCANDEHGLLYLGGAEGSMASFELSATRYFCPSIFLPGNLLLVYFVDGEV